MCDFSRATDGQLDVLINRIFERILSRDDEDLDYDEMDANGVTKRERDETIKYCRDNGIADFKVGLERYRRDNARGLV